ncbi:MAG: hypothetical protein AAF527_05225 [Pseudomonadota bacterium]
MRPPEPYGRGGELALLARPLDLEEAVVLRSVLDANGLWCVVLGEYHTLMDFDYRLALGGFPILVQAGDLATAEAAITPPAGAPRDGLGYTCPACGRDAFRRERNLLWYALNCVITLGAIVPYAPYTDRLRCTSCGLISTEADLDKDGDIAP